MKRLLTILIICQLGGCTAPGQSSFDIFGGLLAPSAETQLDCSDQAQAGPFAEEVPPELLKAQANPPDIDILDHPLSGVDIGTVREDLAGLDGCWGRHCFDSFFNETAGFYEVEAWELMKFDIAAGRFWNFKLRCPIPAAVLQASPSAIATELPFFIADEYKIVSIGENTVELEKISGEGAAIDVEGQTLYYCPASGGSYNLQPGDPLYLLATREGNYLKSIDAVEPIQESISFIYELSSEYWVRLDCP